MEQKQVNRAIVGNDFVVRQRPVRVAPIQPAVAGIPTMALSIEPLAATSPRVAVQPAFKSWAQLLSRYSFLVFALLFLLISSLGVKVGGRYYEAHVLNAAAASVSKPILDQYTISLSGSDVASTMQRLEKQQLQLDFDGHPVQIPATTIATWLKASDTHQPTAYLHIKEAAVAKSLNQLAAPFVHSAVNEVSVTHDGTTREIVSGQNGTALTDPAAAAQQLARAALAGNGLQLQVPMKTVAAASVTPAAFNKLLEVNLSSHQMYAYEHGNVVRTFAVSAGKPSTPTPVGEFHIWAKLTKQTMKGPGYVQPNVPWVNYFDHNGDAVHGVYWHPDSIFGHVNTSHGCVGVANDNGDAKWIYNWAPIGTAVITYN